MDSVANTDVTPRTSQTLTMKSSKVEDADNHLPIESNADKTNEIKLKEMKNKNFDQESSNDNIETDQKMSLVDDPTQPLCESDFEKLPVRPDFVSRPLMRARNGLSEFTNQHSAAIRLSVAVLLMVCSFSYFGWFLYCKTKKFGFVPGNWPEDEIRLIWLSAVFYFCILYVSISALLRKLDIKPCANVQSPSWMPRFKRIAFIVVVSCIATLLVIYIIYSAAVYEAYNLVSLTGITLLLSFSYIFSSAPHMVNWTTVSMGILLQFSLAWIILSTKPGFEIFKFLGDRTAEFLNHTEAGSRFVFGNLFYQHFFAFRILPIVIFMSTVMSILYYLGVIQILVLAMGTIMQMLMGTTSGESLNAVANIFLGMTESPLLIRPLLGRMTNSELHSVMTGGFATIAGSVLAAYIEYGAPANHLLSASVMSAPAALAVSKLICPETKKSKTSKEDMKNLPKCPHQNVVEAATAGATDSIPIVASIAVNVIAFVAILSFFNGTLAWIGKRACLTIPLSFELICSYVFWPLTLTMGVDLRDCRKVAELIGIKTFLNEFLAYERLGKLVQNKKIYSSFNLSETVVTTTLTDILLKFNGTETVLTGGILYADRSLVISTYALCGFANFGSMGILLSSLGSMIPHRKADLSQLIVRAMIAGNVACFLTASIAGLFYKPE